MISISSVSIDRYCTLIRHLSLINSDPYPEEGRGNQDQWSDLSLSKVISITRPITIGGDQHQPHKVLLIRFRIKPLISRSLVMHILSSVVEDDDRDRNLYSRGEWSQQGVRSVSWSACSILISTQYPPPPPSGADQFSSPIDHHEVHKKTSPGCRSSCLGLIRRHFFWTMF